MFNPDFKNEMVELAKHVKTYGLDYCEDEWNELTVGADLALNWSYQLGDNSFTGGAYHFPHWAVVSFNIDTDPYELADEICDQLEEAMAWELDQLQAA